MKKFLLVLLITSACYSQKAKLTAYRLVDHYDHGPCSIKNYIKYNTNGEFSSTYVSAESDDQALINKLLAIKKQAKRWKKSDHYCGEGSFGDPIPHMFVIEKPDGNDTIYTNYENTYLIVPEKQTAFRDKDSLFLKSLTGTIKEFFDHDFKPQVWAMFVQENDSIADTTVTHRGKRAHAYMMESFRDDPGPFRLVSSETRYNEIDWIYKKERDSISFYEGDVRVDLYERDSEFDAAGIKPGDSEKMLIERFPRSTAAQQYYHIRFEDIKRMYFYVVEFKNGKGGLQFFIKDGIIDYIHIWLSSKD